MKKFFSFIFKLISFFAVVGAAFVSFGYYLANKKNKLETPKEDASSDEE